MKNILIIFTLVLILGGGLLYWGLVMKFELPKWSDISALEEKNEKLLEDIKNIEQQRDSLKPLIERYKMETDSLMGVDLLYQIQIKNLKEKNRQLDVRLSRSKDSVLKYRNRWSESVEKYEWMKKNQKVPSNQQTLDFFKKY
jgi:hypothetical protein